MLQPSEVWVQDWLGVARLCRDLAFFSWKVSSRLTLVQLANEQPLKYSSVFLTKSGPAIRALVSTQIG